MKKLFLVLSALCCGLTFAAAPALIVSPDGDLVDAAGKTEFRIGLDLNYVTCGRIRNVGKKWRGKYPDQYRWLYETYPDETYWNRLGINVLHISSPPLAVSALYPDYPGFRKEGIFQRYLDGLTKFQVEKIKAMWNSWPFDKFMELIQTYRTIPYYQDLHFSYTKLTNQREAALKFLPVEALVHPWRFNAFAIPFALGDPAGRDALKRINRFLIELFRSYGADPFMYKLFNEPRYTDLTPKNLARFEASLKGRFGSIAKLNRAWGSSYGDFSEISPLPGKPGYSTAAALTFRMMLEDQLAQTVGELRTFIRENDPGKPAFVQLLGGNHARSLANNTNIYKIHSQLDVISPGTGNFTFSTAEDTDDAVPCRDAQSVSIELTQELMRHGVYFPLAKHKPYVNTEAYIAENRAENFRAVMWRELAIGKSFLLFWGWGGLLEPGVPQPIFALHNPAVQPPEELRAFTEFRRELKPVAELFVGRKKKLWNPKAAFLFSNSTLRSKALTSAPAGLETGCRFVGALHFRHYDYAGLLEENLAETLPSYRLLALGSVTHLSRSAEKAIRDFVRGGGIVVAADGTADRDEYNVPYRSGLFDVRLASLPKLIGSIPEFGIRGVIRQNILSGNGWESRGTSAGKTVIARKKFGRGELWYIAADLSDYALAEVLAPLLKKQGVKPYAEVRKTTGDDPMPNIEVFPFRNGETFGWLLFNQNRETKAFRFSAPGLAGTVVDPTARESYPVQDGSVTLILKNRDVRVLVAGADAAKYGSFPLQTPERIPELVKAARAEERRRIPLRPSTVLPLVGIANTGFDNAQNWEVDSAFVDAGHRYLRAVPFHEQRFADVRFDIIRFDYNNNRTCVALKSKRNPEFPESVSLPVNLKTSAFAFLLAGVGGKAGEPLLTFRIRYADGSVAEAVGRATREIGSWNIAANPEEVRKRAVWNDGAGYGFFYYELANPNPSREVAALELVSTNGGGTPVICAISALHTIFQKEYAHRVNVCDAFPLMLQPASDANNRYGNGVLRSNGKYIELSSRDRKPVPNFGTAAEIDRAVLRGTIRLERDDFGKKYVLSWFVIRLCGLTASGEMYRHGAGDYMGDRNFTEHCLTGKNTDYPVEFEIPLKNLRHQVDKLAALVIFGGRQPVVKEIRDLRIEY